MAYTTVSNVEAYLNTTFTTETSPTLAQVTQMVDDIDSEVDSTLGTSFTQQTEEEILDLRVATNRFLVSKYPLISVNSVEYNTGTEYSPTWVAFNNYRTNGDFIIGDKYMRGDVAVKLNYEWGHVTVPSDVEYLATLMVVRRIISQDADATGGTTSLGIGSLSLSKSAGTARLANIDNTIAQQIRRTGYRKTVFK